ncbi:MAG: sugar phosphate isomerase/epimerase [Desulfobacterales bacterium]|nr:sugar phosphate isomerase/epimerase [Desulfobacterales bacterium]
MNSLLRHVQVNCPFTLLVDRYLDRFLDQGINPEIGIDATALDRFDRADFIKVARSLAERGLTVTLHAPFADLAAGSSDPDVRRVTRHRLEQTLALVPVFRPRTVVCHAGYDWKRHGFDGTAWLERSAAVWAWFGRQVRDEGAVMMLENVYERGPEEMTGLFDALDVAGTPSGFCLDTGHQSAFSRTDLDGWLDGLGPRLGQLHLHDNTGEFDDHLAPGQGTIGFPAFLQRLGGLGPKLPVVTLEPHREEDLEPALGYLDALWPWPR